MTFEVDAFFVGGEEVFDLLLVFGVKHEDFLDLVFAEPGKGVPDCRELIERREAVVGFDGGWVVLSESVAYQHCVLEFGLNAGLLLFGQSAFVS